MAILLFSWIHWFQNVPNNLNVLGIWSLNNKRRHMQHNCSTKFLNEKVYYRSFSPMSLFMKKLLVVSGKAGKKKQNMSLDYKFNMVSNLPYGKDCHG